jgi:flagellar biosynthesis/type III secretory pathway chaperone
MNYNGQFSGWKTLAEAVRDELRESAWLLSLLDDQQKAILDRDADAILRTNDAIEEQLGEVQSRHQVRLALMREASAEGRLLAGDSIKDLIPFIPAALQPLFNALTQEAITLRERINRKNELNRRMLERAASTTSELLGILHPGSVTRTYGRRGTYNTRSGLSGSVMRTAV